MGGAKAATTSVPSDNAIVGYEPKATWLSYVPETFGLRANLEKSKYRWCAREAAMWGIATGTAMTLHRFRMRTSVKTAVHVGFVSVFIVMGGSYYSCVKRRDYQEQMIELMMKYNAAEHAQVMPEPIPVDANHPFVAPTRESTEPQYTVAILPERKEWQDPLPTQDIKDVFKLPEQPKQR
jgi:Protein of unknown function (DUF3767)